MSVLLYPFYTQQCIGVKYPPKFLKYLIFDCDKIIKSELLGAFYKHLFKGGRFQIVPFKHYNENEIRRLILSEWKQRYSDNFTKFVSKRLLIINIFIFLFMPILIILKSKF